MSLRKSRGYKYVLWALTLACLGGAGYLGYRTFAVSASADKELKLAEAAYARGLETYQAKNWGEAALNFDKAGVQADKALEALDLQVKDNKLPAEEAQPLLGRVLWVKARAIRDRAYAEGQKEGKPLQEIPDVEYKETYRAFAQIPPSQTQLDAFNALRRAAHFLNSDKDKDLAREVVKESLRLELSLLPIDWSVVAPLLRKSVEFDPADVRANYFLAQYEYEQPGETGGPSPYERRAADRIDLAKGYLAAAKKNGAAFWRTAGLEAEIAAWPVRTAAARKLKPDVVAAAEKAVDDLMFDPQNGLVIVAGRGEKLAGLRAADTRGLVSVLAVGTERGVANVRKPGGTRDRLRTATQAALDLANKMNDDPALKPQLREVGAVLIAAAAEAQPYLAADETGWKEYLAGVDALIAKAPEVSDGPFAHLQLARVAGYDADLAARNNQSPVRIKELRERVVREAEAGLKAASAPAVTDELHLLLAEAKLQAGARGEEVEPHLARLRVSTVPRFKLIGQFFDARVAEHRGFLQKARELLLKVAADRGAGNGDVVFRAQVLLAGLAQATNDTLGSLAALKEVETKYNSPDLPPHARAWADQILGGQDTILGSLVAANLGVALQARAKYLNENPGKQTVPAELVKGYEDSAAFALGKLKGLSRGDWLARMADVQYQLAIGRRAEAVALVDKIALDYPDNVGVLRTRCLLLAVPARGRPLDPNGVAAADQLIRKYIKDFPDTNAGKLFQAEWMMMTGRADEAVKYLNDPETFPKGRDASVERALAAALMTAGQREEAQKILSKLPPEQGLGATLLRALSPEFGEKLKASLVRYEDQGAYRFTDAAVKLNEGKYEEAARGFASALEFDRQRDAARSGLQLTLINFAEKDPAKARDAAVRLAVDYPDQAGVYVAAALAALYLEEVGNPDDNWESTKTMYAAVNRWEAAALKAGLQRADVAATRAQFRLIAGDVDGARKEAVTNASRNPKHVPTLFMVAELNLLPPTDPAEARRYLDRIRQENADDPRVPQLEAVILVAEDNWAGAAKIYEKAAGEFPRSPVVYPPVILAAERLGNKDAALGWARKWAEQLPNDAGATAEVIRLLALTGKKGDAVKLADAFVARREKEARDRAGAADPPPKAEEVEKAAGLARASALLTVVAAFHRAKEYDLAVPRAAEVAKTYPKAESLLLLNGDAAIAREEWDKALDVYRDLLKENPRHFIAGNNAAWILAQKQNKAGEALALVEAVRKGRSGRPVGPERLPADFLDTIGVVYLKLNDPGRAGEMRALFEAATRRYPADPRLATFYAYALAATGEKSRAMEVLDTALRLTKLKYNGLSEEKNKLAAVAIEEAKKKIK